MKFSDLKAKSPEQQMALSNCIALFRVGSNLYGTNHADSDDDYFGVFVPDIEFILGKKKVETIEFKTNKSDSGSKNKKGDLDCTMHSLDKFLTLLQGNNPNIIETLFVNAQNTIYCSTYFDEIIKNKHLFISLKSFHSFRGYAHQQKEQMLTKSGNQTGRKELQEKFGYDTKLASHNLRLLLECTQLLKEHQITFPLKEAKLLIDVKNGKLTKEEFFKESDRLGNLVDMVYANSTLPHSPDSEAIHRLQINLHREFYDI